MARQDSVETTNKQEDALNTAQVEFTLNPRFLSPPKKYFLEVQGSLFEELERFSAAWFQRRQEAMQEMIAVSKQMLSSGQGDTAISIKRVSEWHRESMARLAEDAKEYSEFVGRCAKALAQNTGTREPTEKAK